MIQKVKVATVAAVILIICAAGTARAENHATERPQNVPTQNVNVVNTPTVNVGTLPAVTLNGTPTVNVGSLPAVTVAGTPAVSATVANTASNPVPSVDTERNARIPYLSTAEVSCGTGYNVCVFNPTAPPPGYRLVGQWITGNIRLTDTSTTPLVSIRVEGSNNFLNVPVSVGSLNSAFGVISQTIVSYWSFAPEVEVAAIFGTPFTSQVTIGGYLENCTVTGCPAVVH